MALQSWLLINAIPLINIVGIFCDIIGAFFVAYEVVNIFNDEKYYGQPNPFGLGVRPPRETKEYQAWNQLKNRKMKIGLAFLVFGFMLQVVANVLQIKCR